MPIKKIDKLQIESSAFRPNMTFWRIQFTLRLLLIVFLILTALGLTGSGILNRGQIGKPGDAIWLNYEKFSRKNATTQLKINVSKVNSAQTKVWISTSYLNKQYIKQITPVPVVQAVKGNKLFFTFDLTGDHNEIVFLLEPQTIGLSHAKIGLDNQEFEFQQFVYF